MRTAPPLRFDGHRLGAVSEGYALSGFVADVRQSISRIAKEPKAVVMWAMRSIIVAATLGALAVSAAGAVWFWPGNPDDALRATIRAEVPGLEDTLNSDKLGAAALLVRWAAKESVFGSPAAGREDPQANAIAMHASAIHALYKREEPTLCGGAAVFFMKVLGLFGIEAFIVDSGYSDPPMTHVTTIVPVGSKFYVIDPTFGGTFRTADGAIADLATVFESPQNVRFSAQPVDRTFVVRPEDADEARRAFAAVNVPPACAPREDGGLHCEVTSWADHQPVVRTFEVRPEHADEARREFAAINVPPGCALREDGALRCQVPYWVDQMRAEWADEMREHSFPPGADLIRQFLLRHVFTTSAEGETRRAFLALIERHRSAAARNEER